MSIGFQEQLRCFQESNYNIFLAEEKYRMKNSQLLAQNSSEGNLLVIN